MVLHRPHCNDFAANISNKNLPGKLKIPLFTTIILLEREDVRQLRDLPYHNLTSRRTQRNKPGA